MPDETGPAELTRKTVVYEIPGMDAVAVWRDVAYSASGADRLTMDVYLPPDFAEGERRPAVVVVAGYPDAGFQKMLGCRFKEMGSTASWGRLIAASGLVAVTYTNREPVTDVAALLRYLRENGPSLGIDGSRIGLWASSGNVPLALSALIAGGPSRPACAVLCYGYTLDLEGSTAIADASRAFGFANPAAGKSVSDLSQAVPLFIARAGRDETPRLNESLDRFVAAAMASNLPVTFVNHPQAPHAFDLFHDSETSRETIRQVVAFFRFHLLGETAR